MTMATVTTDTDDFFKAMIDAPAPGRGNYISGDGDYLVEVTKFIGKDGFKGKSAIVEFKVLESTNAEVPVGCTRSWTLKWDKKQNHADLKAFALAAFNLDKLVGTDDVPTKRDADAKATYLVYAAVGPAVAGQASVKARELLGADEDDDFFAGQTLRLTTEKTKTQAGGDFTRHAWQPV